MARACLVLAALGLAALAVLPGGDALYSAGGPVTELTPTNFKSTVGKGVWMVEFYAPWCGHCKQLAPEWTKAAKALQGIVGVGAVDADAHNSLGSQYGVRGFPTIKFMYESGGKIKTVDYEGARSSSAIIDFAFQQAKKVATARAGGKASSGGSKSSGGGGGGGGGAGAGSEMYPTSTGVVSLTDDNFESEVIDGAGLWMVEFYAPWCGHCKALKPAWIESAKDLKGKVRMGAVDCTVHQAVCGKYGVQGYPTIKAFAKGKKKDYQGGRDAGAITEFATKMWAKYAEPPEVVELSSPAVWDKNCGGGKPKQMCIIAFLPHILDTKAAGRNKYIDVLKGLAKEFADRPFGFLWVQGAEQAALEASVGVGGYGYPAVVALAPGKKAYAAMRTSMELAHAKEFVENVRNGMERLTAVSGAVGEVVDITPWDGSDGAIIEEDEFDLSDIMGDDDEDAGHDEL